MSDLYIEELISYIWYIEAWGHDALERLQSRIVMVEIY